MVNYKNGKIYKIVSPYTNEIYVGSTAKKYLCDRYYQHKSRYVQWLQEKRNFMSSTPLIAYGDSKIFLLEAYPCETKDQLRAQEQKWIEYFGELCINTYSAILNVTRRNEKKQLYRKQNKQKIREYDKNYRQKNLHTLTEKFNCECGGKYTKEHTTKHEKTQRHKNYFKSF